MNFSESLRQALDSLKSNKLRSVLTMLGIVMGVFSIVAIMVIGSATESYISAEFEKIGANRIDITYKTSNVSRDEWLVIEDMSTITRVAPEIKSIATMTQQMGTFRVGAKTRDAILSGVSSQYRNFDLIEMASGRFINDFDVSARSNVVIVDEFFANNYFNTTDVVGNELVLRTSWGRTQKLKIVGVRKSGDDLFGSMLNNEHIPTFAYMPITTLQSIFYNNDRLSSISILVEDQGKMREVGERVVKALEINRGKQDIYMAQNSADMQSAINSVLAVISGVLLAIAIITLLVGGIGIVNILLVSVTERIREIGVRKALGAQKKDIVFQFLTESVIMTSISGMIGILIGMGIGGLISYIIKIPPMVDLTVATLAFTCSILLGIIFGVYPAKKAADLDPIESLRYE